MIKTPDSETRGRVLAIALYLRDHTDEQHSVTIDQIIEACYEKGYSGTRKTVADDLKALKKEGLAFEIENLKVTEKKRYFFGREFQPEELRILVDIVSSSRSLDEVTRIELIDKIAKLASMPNRAVLTGNWVNGVATRAASDEIKRTLDHILAAITLNRNIEFQYYEYDRNKERKLRNNGEVYRVSPYDLVYQGDKYYLLCYSYKREKTVSFRVERMMNVQIQNDMRYIDAGYDLDQYMQSTVHMFEGGREAIEIIVKSKNCYMNYVIDQFGVGVDSWPLETEPDYFQFRVCVKPSDTFFSWLFKFQMKIMEPKKLRKNTKK